MPSETPTEDPITLVEINRRIATLERRIIDLIVPIQNIAKVLQSNTDIEYLIKALRGPIPIDDSKLKVMLENFRYEMIKFDKNIDKMNEIVAASHPGEIKYIGNRLNEIEKLIKKLLEEQETKKVNISFSCDGYDLVKKPTGYEPSAPIEKPKNDKELISPLLDTLSERYEKCFIHRFGLFGENRKTYKEIGKLFGISGERIGQIIEKGLRLCRHPSRKRFIEKLPQGHLRKAITGD